MRFELRLQGGPERASLYARGARSSVDFEHTAKLAQVDRHRRLMALRIALWLNAADDARSAAKGCNAHLRAARPVEYCRDLVLGARVGNDVRRAGVVAGEPADVIGKRLAVGVRSAVVVRGRAE